MKKYYALLLIIIAICTACKTPQPIQHNYKYLYLEYELINDSECGKGLDPGELYLSVKSQFTKSSYIYPINVGDAANSKKGFISTPLIYKAPNEKVIFTLLDQNMLKSIVGEPSREITSLISSWLDKEIPNPADLLKDWVICGDGEYTLTPEFIELAQSAEVIIKDAQGNPKLKLILTYRSQM